MKEQELVAAVRQTAGTDTAEHTEQAVRATLAVLGERLAGGEPVISPANCRRLWPK
jgi:uncharacterized protein (DUF2267 family)